MYLMESSISRWPFVDIYSAQTMLTTDILVDFRHHHHPPLADPHTFSPRRISALRFRWQLSLFTGKSLVSSSHLVIRNGSACRELPG